MTENTESSSELGFIHQFIPESTRPNQVQKRRKHRWKTIIATLSEKDYR